MLHSRWGAVVGGIPAGAPNPKGSNAGRFARAEGGTPSAHARLHCSTGAVATEDSQRIFCLSRCANELLQAGRLSRQSDARWDERAAQTQPTATHHLGSNVPYRYRVVTCPAHPSSVAGGSFCRQTSKVGARCPNWARRDLCGECSVMGISTAITVGPLKSLINPVDRAHFPH